MHKRLRFPVIIHRRSAPQEKTNMTTLSLPEHGGFVGRKSPGMRESVTARQQTRAGTRGLQ